MGEPTDDFRYWMVGLAQGLGLQIVIENSPTAFAYRLTLGFPNGVYVSNHVSCVVIESAASAEAVARSSFNSMLSQAAEHVHAKMSKKADETLHNKFIKYATTWGAYPPALDQGDHALWAGIEGYGQGSWPGEIITPTPGAELAGAIPALLWAVPCPVVECPGATDGGSTLENTIIHLNDQHTWKREAIADWLDTLPLDLTFQPASVGD